MHRDCKDRDARRLQIVGGASLITGVLFALVLVHSIGSIYVRRANYAESAPKTISVADAASASAQRSANADEAVVDLAVWQFITSLAGLVLIGASLRVAWRELLSNSETAEHQLTGFMAPEFEPEIEVEVLGAIDVKFKGIVTLTNTGQTRVTLLRYAYVSELWADGKEQGGGGVMGHPFRQTLSPLEKIKFEIDRQSGASGKNFQIRFGYFLRYENYKGTVINDEVWFSTRSVPAIPGQIQKIKLERIADRAKDRPYGWFMDEPNL